MTAIAEREKTELYMRMIEFCKINKVSDVNRFDVLADFVNWHDKELKNG